jgi:acyl carrier protein
MASATPLTQTEALAMLAECFMDSPENLTPQTLRESVAGWDSMGALMLMAELDERFGIVLSADESKAMSSIGDALKFLREQGALVAA